MSDQQQHCPGFETNKNLSEVKVRCKACGAEFEIFSDELERTVKCSACGVSFDPKECLC